MHDVKAVARTMINMAAERNIEITNLKLQKLLYFAHGLMLARHQTSLVDEEFQAWRYGPVLENLYHSLKIFGPSPISPADGFVKYWPVLPESSEQERAVINDVLEQLGNMSGGELISISHDPQGPWHAVFEGSTRNTNIGNEQIERYFRTIVSH